MDYPFGYRNSYTYYAGTGPGGRVTQREPRIDLSGSNTTVAPTGTAQFGVTCNTLGHPSTATLSAAVSCSRA